MESKSSNPQEISSFIDFFKTHILGYKHPGIQSCQMYLAV